MQKIETSGTAMLIEKKPVSLPQLIGYAVIIAVNSFVAGGIWISTQNRIDKIDDKVTRTNSTISQVNTAVAQVKAQVEPLPNIIYRVGQNEARNDAQDVRIDRVMESIASKLDALSADVSAVKTDVRVLTERVETSITGRKASSLRRQTNANATGEL